MQIQYNGEEKDIEKIVLDLESKGVKVVSSKASRWIGEADGQKTDNGGRIDIEVPDDYVLPEKQALMDMASTVDVAEISKP